MRFASLSILFLSSVALAGCGGGGSSGIANLSSGLNICGQSCPIDTPTSSTPTNTPATNSGGQNLPPIDTNNGGNATNLTTGDKALALESAVLTSTKDNKTLVQVAINTKNTASKGDDEATFSIDTGDDRNGGWPVPKKMAWERTAQLLNPTRLGANSYDEYWSSEQVNGALLKEQLQVWNYDHAYIGQFRETAAAESPHQAWFFGGTANTALANMPTTATTISKTGQFTGTAKTYNFRDVDPITNQVFSANNWWSVRGTSEVEVNFANKTVDATLTPTHFTSSTEYDSADRSIIAGDQYTVDLAVARSNPASIDRANYFQSYMDEQIKLTGTIVAGTGGTGNQIANGSVTFANPSPLMTDPDTGQQLSFWKPVQNVDNFQGAFYGPNAEEFVGAFAVSGTTTGGSGSAQAIAENTGANYDFSGIIHAE
jgi:hypothetical protein